MVALAPQAEALLSADSESAQAEFQADMNRLPKLVRILLVLSALSIAVFGLLRYLAQPVPDHPYYDPAGFMVIAHRGGRSLGPENTLHTYRRAVDLGVDVLEIDVHLTRDKHLAVIHDKTVDRTTNGSGAVESFNLDELKFAIKAALSTSGTPSTKGGVTKLIYTLSILSSPMRTSRAAR